MQRFAVSGLLLLLAGCGGSEPPAPSGISVESALGGGAAEGYARAERPRAFEFPADHGPHPEYRNEWWYLTGNLESAEGERFGFQVTFFRIALAPRAPERASAWAANQVWMAHAALTDAGAGAHEAEERFSRQALDLAGAQAEPFAVWLDDWRLGATGTGPAWRLEVDGDAFALDLALEPAKPVVLQGDRGLSQKSAEPGNASYYYSIPRLEATGRLRSGSRELQVEGLAWLDREWSTSALGPDQEGWDWFSLQLDDGRDLMFYRLRRTDGSADPHSAGTLVAADGSYRAVGAGDVELRPLRWWEGQGHRYPVAWELRVGPWQQTFRVQAVVEDQLMDLSVRYWEGAVDVVDPATGATLGAGYLELAGY